MRIVYMGNQDIGVRCLDELISHGENVVAVFALRSSYWQKVSNGEHEEIWSGSVENAARGYGLEVHVPEDINHPHYVDLIRELDPDIILSISWDQMLKPAILDIPSDGCINMHFSLLPENRGHAPVNWAIIHGYTRTGVTMHYMVPKADQGDIIGQREIEIGFHETIKQVYERLEENAVELFLEVLKKIKTRQVNVISQRHNLSSYGQRRRPSDGLIDWQQSAFDIYNWVRALTHPYPGAFTHFRGRKLLVWEVLLYENTSSLGEPGCFLESLPLLRMRVAAGSGSVLLRCVQFEGEKEMDASVFFDKHQVVIGELLTMLPEHAAK